MNEAEWFPMDSAPKDGTWLSLRGQWTTRDGVTARWVGFWQRRDGGLAAYQFDGWRRADNHQRST